MVRTMNSQCWRCWFQAEQLPSKHSHHTEAAKTQQVTAQQALCMYLKQPWASEHGLLAQQDLWWRCPARPAARGIFMF